MSKLWWPQDALRGVDPTAKGFWQRVAKKVPGGKTSDECHNQYLAQFGDTPAAKPGKTRKSAAAQKPQVQPRGAHHLPILASDLIKDCSIRAVWQFCRDQLYSVRGHPRTTADLKNPSLKNTYKGSQATADLQV